MLRTRQSNGELTFVTVEHDGLMKTETTVSFTVGRQVDSGIDGSYI